MIFTTIILIFPRNDVPPIPTVDPIAPNSAPFPPLPPSFFRAGVHAPQNKEFAKID